MPARFDCAWAKWKVPAEPWGAVACLAAESPVLFQGVPDRPPVLSGRLNNDFLDRVLDQPVGQATQISRRST